MQAGFDISENEKRHVHHSYMWLGSLRMAGMILFVSAISMGPSFIGVAAEGEMDTADGAQTVFIVFALCALVILAVVLAAVVYQVVSYKYLYYQLGETEFSLYKGIFSKKHVHVPYQRVQSVDQRASLFQRIFGVCTVSIDTAGGSANKAVMVPYLTKQDAEILRAELFARKAYVAAVAAGADPAAVAFAVASAPSPASAGTNLLDLPADVWGQFNGVFGGEGVDTGLVAYEYGLSNKELALTGLSNNTAFIFVIVGVLGVVFEIAEMIFATAPGAGELMVHAVMSSAGSQIAGGLAFMAISSLLGMAVLIWLISAAGVCISYGGFHARRRGSRIEVERGLLQHRFQGVDIDRVQSVTIKQSFIRRLMGYCEISIGKIDAAQESSDGSKQPAQQGLVIHPFVKVDRAAEILAGIIPEYADVPRDAIPLAPSARRRAIVRRCIIQGFGFWLAALTALGQIALHLLVPHAGAELAASLPYIDRAAIVVYVLSALLFAIDLAGALLWARESSFAVNRRFMQISNGGLSRESVSFTRQKVQYGFTKANPLQRRAKTATIHARTAAGIGGTTVRLIDVRAEDAAAWLVWLMPKR